MWQTLTVVWMPPLPVVLMADGWTVPWIQYVLQFKDPYYDAKYGLNGRLVVVSFNM